MVRLPRYPSCLATRMVLPSGWSVWSIRVPSGVTLPSELAEELGLTLETRSGPVVGATGVGQGWVHALTARFPDLDDLSFSVEALFLPELPIALIGRDPFFQRMVVAFHHGQGSLYFNAA